MARRNRQDLPGTWHHVINRGIARRPLFEDRADIRYFLSRLAREVRRGRLEIHAWTILTTHYHLLVVSPAGMLSEAMRRAQNEYSRYFNRRHRRDGALVRGRFFSRPVDSLRYRQALVRYIDSNPVQARLAPCASLHEFGSAYHYASDSGPPWMQRAWVETEVRLAASSTGFRSCDYSLAFPPLVPGSISRTIARRIERSEGSDALDHLVQAAPPRVKRWLQRKARLADGMPVGQPVCDRESIRLEIGLRRAAHGPWPSPLGCRVRDLWDIAEVALLRDLAGQTWSEIAAARETAVSTSHARYQIHGKLLSEVPGYAERVAVLASRVIDRCWIPKYGVAPDSSGRPRRPGLGRRLRGLPEESGATPYFGIPVRDSSRT